MSAIRKFDERISEQTYFALEKKSNTRHEYIDGYVYAMVGGSFNRVIFTLMLLLIALSSKQMATC